MSISIIMAGGLSKRFKSDIPKIIYPVHDIPMIIHIIKKCFLLDIEKILIVVGIYEKKIKECVEKYIDNVENIYYVKQENADGTGGAIKACLNYIENYENVYILSGDVPFINIDTLKSLTVNSILTTILENPYGNGRIVEKDNFIKIIEEKDCLDEEKKIKKVNCGIYYLQTRHLLEHIPKLDKKNASGELYLTDIMQYIENIDLIHLQNRFEIYNINTLEDLENATKINIRR
jgi:bifunctional UDP-N-acetylglucosamine pyrophosphorylase/glucosamine-1-phosphate N-acetyltransferase